MTLTDTGTGGARSAVKCVPFARFGALLVASLSLTGCEKIARADPTSVGQVILYRGGQVETSSVHKTGPSCFVSWYGLGVDKTILHRDGTADDEDLHYSWTLAVSGLRDEKADRNWYDAHCADQAGGWRS